MTTAPATYDLDQFYLSRGMKIALIASALFHIGMVVLGTVGLPYISNPPILPPQPIAVEIVDVSEMTTTNKKPNPIREKPAKKPEPAKTEKSVVAPPKVETKEPPKIKPLDEVKEKKDTVKPKPKVPPPPAEKLEEAKPPEKPEETKEEATEQEDQFLSVLKNLQEGDVATESENVAEMPAPEEMSPLAKFSERLSASEVDAIVIALNRQFANCWNLMAGARNAEDITVSIKLVVNPNRTVQSARIADQFRYNQDSFYRAAADTALRAIRHPNCETLDLPPDKYDLWKNLTFNFNPSAQL